MSDIQPVTVGIKQCQSAAAVLNAHSLGAARRACEDGVLHLEMQRVSVLLQADADETRLVGGDAVLEGVFHERDEHHGRHGHSFVLHPVREADIGEPVQTQLLQVDVLANILHLLRKGDS